MRRSILSFRLNVFALVALFAFALLTSAAKAETSSRTRKSTTTITTTESESEGDEAVEQPAEDSKPAAKEESKEGVMTAKFGSKATSGTAGCKTEALSKGVIKDLKGDCNAWIKDQKADLKGRYLTGSCEESCDDCGMSLQRCTVNGTIKYLQK